MAFILDGTPTSSGTTGDRVTLPSPQVGNTEDVSDGGVVRHTPTGATIGVGPTSWVGSDIYSWSFRLTDSAVVDDLETFLETYVCYVVRATKDNADDSDGILIAADYGFVRRDVCDVEVTINMIVKTTP